MNTLQDCDNYIACIYQCMAQHLSSCDVNADCDDLYKAMILMLEFREYIQDLMVDTED